MSYNASNLWSDAEDNSVRQFYPRHGMRWEGWAEVLPNRSMRAIDARAKRLGVQGPPRPEPKYPRRVRRKGGDDSHYKLPTPNLFNVPDPNESYVMSCMRQLMAPSDIDRARHWIPGTAKRIILRKWSRENE